MKKIILLSLFFLGHVAYGQYLKLMPNEAVIEVQEGSYGLIHKSGSSSIYMRNASNYLYSSIYGLPNLLLGVNDGPARIKLINGVIENVGYTAFGSDAPFIKTKKLTGITASAAGSSVSSIVAHGVNPQKILAVSLFVQYTEGGQLYLHPEEDNSIQASATYLINGPNIIVLNKPGSSSTIYNTPFVLYVTYEQ